MYSCGSAGPKENLAEEPAMSEMERAEYLEMGSQIAQRSFKALSGKLKAEISENGMEGAIAKCDLYAASTIDSIQKAFGVSIKRTALRTRNQENKPTDEEKHLLKLYERADYAGEELKPMLLIPDSSTVKFFSAIKMQALCLNCHGEPGTTMSEEIYAKIIEKYPTDKAIGYKLGEFRGLWSIEFKR